ncbi:MAG: hypothetical protein M1823_005173 [Watsoniomyces obsoletus]|nr:MAG: hypothetical protein M1823_005173 [Watsoniomyces obsoletus]
MGEEPATPASSPPTPPTTLSPPARARYKDLKQWLPLYLSRTDDTISRLNKILSTTSGTDTLLLTTNYSLLTLLTCLDIYSRRRLERTAVAVAEKASAVVQLLPGETLIAAVTESSTSRLTRTTRRLRALTDLISDVRVFLRLWGLLGVYSGARQTWLNPPRDLVTKRIVWAQILASAAYQYLENTAYLAQHGILDWETSKQAKAWLWSARFWAIYVALDMGRLWRVKNLQERKVAKEMIESVKLDAEKEKQSESEGAGEKKEMNEESVPEAEAEQEEVLKEEKETLSVQPKDVQMQQRDDGKAKKKEMIQKWWRQLYVNAAYAPLTLHWSLEGGMVGDLWIGILGSAAGLVGLKQLWREAA